MGIFKRLKTVEQKLDAIMEAEQISFKRQPWFKVIKKEKGEMGFKVKNGNK